AAMFWKQINQEIPDINIIIRNGEFREITRWLRKKIHRYGRLETPSEILRRVTGEELSARPFIDYISEKIDQVYFG
ncbi:MAG: carboxypeptidase M32, partial [Candidatus Kapaibacterium sp.]